MKDLVRRKPRCPVTDQVIPSVKKIKRRLEKGLRIRSYGFPEGWRSKVAWAIARLYYESSKKIGIPETIRRGELVFEGAKPLILQSTKTQTMATGIAIPVWPDKFDRKGFTGLVRDLMDGCPDPSGVLPSSGGGGEVKPCLPAAQIGHRRILGVEGACEVLAREAEDRRARYVYDRRRVVLDVVEDRVGGRRLGRERLSGSASNDEDREEEG